MKRILDLENKFKIRLVTGEFEILTHLYFNGPTRSRELSLHTKSSVANFQIILRRMRDDGLIVYHQIDLDGRVRVYDLAREVRQEISETFKSESESRSIFSAMPFTAALGRNGLITSIET